MRNQHLEFLLFSTTKMQNYDTKMSHYDINDSNNNVSNCFWWPTKVSTILQTLR